MFFLSASFSSDCSVVRSLNDRTSYQVELGRNGYTEWCLLAYVGENTIPVCAYVVNFHLACTLDKRLVLVLLRERGYNQKVHFFTFSSYFVVSILFLAIYKNNYIIVKISLLRVCNKGKTTGTTSGAGTAYHSGAPEFTPGF